MALNKEELTNEIKGEFAKNSGLQYEIMEDLKEVEMKFGDNVTINPFDADQTKEDFKKVNPDIEPRTMTKVPTNNRDTYTATEAMVEVIVEKTVDRMIDKIVDHILNNLEITIPVGKVVVSVTGGDKNINSIVCNKK